MGVGSMSDSFFSAGPASGLGQLSWMLLIGHQEKSGPQPS